MIFNSPDRIAALTPNSPFGRRDDGRPDSPDDLLERLKLVTNDEAWGVLERRNDYHFQFEGGWPVHLHSDVTLTGRAVTAQYVPKRPDLNDVVQSIGESEGRSGGQNTWIIDQLEPGDVLVVDLFGKIEDGTFIGDNLGTAIAARAGTGLVVDGGIRDYERVRQLEDFNVFCRGVHPSAILIGDVIIGTVENGTRRRFVQTPIVNRWTTAKPAYRLTLADGTPIVASGDRVYIGGTFTQLGRSPGPYSGS